MTFQATILAISTLASSTVFISLLLGLLLRVQKVRAVEVKRLRKH
jgi:hypothetical protein